MRMTDKTATGTKGPDPFDVQVTGAMSISLRRCVFYLTFAEYHLFLKQPEWEPRQISRGSWVHINLCTN